MELLAPIHRAAFEGNLAEVEQLIKEDGSRLNAGVEQGLVVHNKRLKGCTPLAVAAWRGQTDVVKRLLELGADTNRRNVTGFSALHHACIYGHTAVVSMLLDAGGSVNDCTETGITLLMAAAGVYDCPTMELLIGRGGHARRPRCHALKLDARDDNGATAFYFVMASHHAEDDAPTRIAALLLLLEAGADPTIPTYEGRAPLDMALEQRHQPTIALLRAAIAEPERPRLLFKARAVVDATVAIPKASQAARDKGLSLAAQQKAMLEAVPAFLKGRVREGDELPVIGVEGKDGALGPCVDYALNGMVPEVFVELLEMLLPRWDPALKGRPLGVVAFEEEKKGLEEILDDADYSDDDDDWSGDDDDDDDGYYY